MDLIYVNAFFGIVWEFIGFFILLYKFTSFFSYVVNFYSFCKKCCSKSKSIYYKIKDYFDKKYSKVEQRDDYSNLYDIKTDEKIPCEKKLDQSIYIDFPFAKN
jgi:hypothetical protein